METDRFDQLEKSLTTSGSRRGLVGLLTAVPVIGGLAALLGDEAAGKGRRTRRQKAGHEKELTAAKRKKKKNKKKKKTCKPQPPAATGAGKCGLVPNNCQKTVDCGSCACDPLCPVCERCNSGDCQPDPNQQGDACGAAGQICLVDGSCACDAGSCGLGTVCLDGTCVECGFIGAPCCSSNNCQSGAVCIDGICEVCGIAGQPCCAGGACSLGAACSGGQCVE